MPDKSTPEPPLDRRADLRLFGLRGLPEIQPGADLADLILTATEEAGLSDGDVLVVAQKAVSKAEDRIVDLRDVEPSPLARTIATAHQRDPRHIEVILR